VSARIVHELAVVVGAEVAGLAWVGAVVAVAMIAVAAVVDDANVVARRLAFDAVVVVVGAVVVALCRLAFDVAVGGVVVAVGDLRLLWLRYQGRIAACNS